MPLIEVFFANTHLGVEFDGKVFFLIIQGKCSLQKFLHSPFFGTSQIFFEKLNARLLLQTPIFIAFASES
jgi:hypothetical protein